MQFNLSPGYTLAVRISQKPLIFEGKPIDGMIDDSRRIIWISCDVGARDRRRVLFHELRHGWTFARGGKPDGDEADAIDVAALMDMIDEQFTSQGGATALMALKPLESGESPSTLTGSVILVDRHECPCCGMVTMTGSVQTSAAENDSRFGEFVVERWFDCDGCGSVVFWKETALPDGTPKSRFIPNSVGHLRGADRVAWLRDREAVSV